jgi:hypothetical protein
VLLCIPDIKMLSTKPGNDPGFTRDEKELSRVKKELKQVLAKRSNGKDEVLQVREARIDSWLCRKHFNVRHRC